MFKIGLVLFGWVMMAGNCSAQQDYFALIRSDGRQPFFVQIGEKTLSSSGQGYLIISELKDSTYHLTIGFPKKKYPEQTFALVMAGRDHELRLEDRPDKGWFFVDPQNGEAMKLQPADTLEGRPLEGVRKDDAFSRMMAGVVNDTAVMYNTYTADRYLKDSSSGPVDITRALKDTSRGLMDSVRGMVIHSSKGFSDSLLNQVSTPNAPPDTSHIRATDSSLAIAPVAPKPHKAAIIKKISQQETDTSLLLFYTTHIKGQKSDTIDIQIPLDSASVLQTPPASNPSGAPPVSHLSRPPAVDTSSASPPIIHPITPPRTDSTSKVAHPPVKEKPVLINSDCHNFVTDEEVAKLKTKLEAAASDEARMTAARKVFKYKCMSTSQLRIIVEVFPQESSKYEFLEMAYPSDADDQFAGLIDIFTDPVFIAKFKSLAGIKGH